MDTTNERNDTIKAASEIDNSTLIKMGFQKEENTWVFRRIATPRMEHRASNLNNAEEDDVGAPMEDDVVQAAEGSCYEMHHSS